MMLGALALATLASCPQAAVFERPEQQEAACALVARSSEATADRATLSRLLDEPEFARARRRNASFLTALWEQFVAWLNALFATSEAARFAKAVPFVVLALAFGVALAALLRFARFRRGAAETPALPSERLPLAPPPEHLANARRLLVSAPREAIREALLALLSSLEQKSFARPDRVKTNRELCAELPTRGADAALVAAVSARVDWFDRTFYSLEAVSPEAARGFVDQVERLVAA